MIKDDSFSTIFFVQMLLKRSIDCIRFVLSDILMSDLNAVDLLLVFIMKTTFC